MSKIYFDTTPLIYFLDDEKPFSDKVANFIAEHQNEDDVFLTNDIRLQQVKEANVLVVDNL